MTIKWKSNATGLMVATAAKKGAWAEVAPKVQDWLKVAGKAGISSKLVSAFSALKTLMDVRQESHLEDNAKAIEKFLKKNPTTSFKQDKAKGSSEFQKQAQILWDAAWQGPLSLSFKKDPEPKTIRYAFQNGFELMEMAEAIYSDTMDELEEMYDDMDDGTADAMPKSSHKWIKANY